MRINASNNYDTQYIGLVANSRKEIRGKANGIERATGICNSQALNVTLHLLPTDLFCKQQAVKSTLRLKQSSLLVIFNKANSCFYPIPRVFVIFYNEN